jgi:hypothetical protein
MANYYNPLDEDATGAQYHYIAILAIQAHVSQADSEDRVHTKRDAGKMIAYLKDIIAKEKKKMTTHLTLKDWVSAYLADHRGSGFNANDIQSAIARMTVRPVPSMYEINNVFNILVKEGKIVEAIPGTQLYKVI